MKRLLYIMIPFAVLSCKSGTGPAGGEGESVVTPGDMLATPGAVALYRNLHAIAPGNTLIGHQDALAYGIGWSGDPFRTDIHDVCGDHPAVFGWDLGHMGDEHNIDGVPFAGMRTWAIAAHEKGGINTYSWHMRNYASGGSSWDTSPCVNEVLPGGSAHRVYLEKLDQAAAFFAGLEDAEGNPVPVIFRPFHEMNGGWFWWGSGSCTPESYKRLFRFTIDYLRREKEIHHLIIAYSTDLFTSAEEYMTWYPGDEYVDVLGFDDYKGLSSKETAHMTVAMLEILDSISTAKSKVMAITETGLETIPDEDWFTDVVLSTLNTNTSTRKAAWVLFWRNGRPDHFYAPHPGHPAVPDFIRFVNDPMILTLSELTDMYKSP